MTGIFLGYYMPWDGLQQRALRAGARLRDVADQTVEGSLVNYENLDNHQTGIHDYFKFLKYGFGRATDIACMHVRRGRLPRPDALELVKRHDGKFPWTYLGKPLEEMLRRHRHDLRRVHAGVRPVHEQAAVRLTDRRGELDRDDRDGKLTKINYDNVTDERGMTSRHRRLRDVQPRLGARGRSRKCGGRPCVTDEPADLDAADRDRAARRRCVRRRDAQPARPRAGRGILGEQVCDKADPFLGVCLGMQLMAAIGDEGGATEGLGLDRRRRACGS